MLSYETLLLIALAFFLGGFVKGVVGLGVPVVVLALLVTTVGLKETMALLLVPTIAMNLWQGLTGGAFLMLIKRLWLKLLCACVGIWWGVKVLVRVDTDLMVLGLGVILLIYAAFSLARPQIRPPGKHEFWLSPFVGVVAGFALFAFQMTGYFTADDSVASIEETADPSAEWRDNISITIPANGWLEYKFGVTADDTFEFAWSTDGEALYYDFHGEAHDAKPDEFTSFEEATSAASAGSQQAPFTGRIGWYWQNDTDAPVVISLHARGQYHIIEQH